MSEPVIPLSELPADQEALLGALGALRHPDTGLSPLVYILVAGACAMILAIGVLLRRLWWRRQRRMRSTAWKAVADRQLSELHDRVARLAPGPSVDTTQCSALLSDASALARRIVLVAEPRAAVASLQGEAWLSELDRLAGGGGRFRTGAARALATAPFQRSPSFSAEQLHDMLDAIQAVADAHAQHQSRAGVARAEVANA